MKKIFRLLSAALLALLILTAWTVPFALAEETEETGGILLVNADNPLPEGYAPAELVNLYEQKRHFRLASSDLYLERETFEAANRMFKQAEDEDMNGFIITSAYRTYEEQEDMYESKPDGIAQKPGHSEHETGMAFDVTARRESGGFDSTPQFKWLIEHCWEFGFILRYPEGKEDITGISYESWHYRYVGVEAALVIRDNNWTLEEYIESLSVQPRETAVPSMPDTAQ